MKTVFAIAAAAVALAACATPPPAGPGVLVLPGSGKNFDQFRLDEQQCRSYAQAQLGGTTTEQAAHDAATKSALVGTAIGVAAGGLLGGAQGAAVGAGVGLAGGAAVGSDMAYSAAGNLQVRYDNAYTQCMYASGHKVPVRGRYDSAKYPSTAPGARIPPPPPPGQAPAGAPADYRPQ